VAIASRSSNAATTRRFLDEVRPEAGGYFRIEVDDAVAIADQVDI
jgi:hypothetical protein